MNADGGAGDGRALGKGFGAIAGEKGSFMFNTSAVKAKKVFKKVLALAGELDIIAGINCDNTKIVHPHGTYL
jgi:hypothetical protein